MKRIASGYYIGEYKGITFEIHKVGEIKETAWYWRIGNDKVHDWHSSKHIAIEAVKEFIDEMNK